MLPGGSRSSRTASACRTFLRRERCKLKQFAAKSKSPGCLTPGKNAKKCKKNKTGGGIYSREKLLLPDGAVRPASDPCLLHVACMFPFTTAARRSHATAEPSRHAAHRIRMHPADGAENTSGRGKACFPRLLACRCGRFSARGQCSLCSALLASLMARAKASVMPMPRMRITE